MRKTFESEVQGISLESVEQRNEVFDSFRRKTAFELVKSFKDPAQKLEFLKEIGREVVKGQDTISEFGDIHELYCESMKAMLSFESSEDNKSEINDYFTNI
jgi:hypothetical protein